MSYDDKSNERDFEGLFDYSKMARAVLLSLSGITGLAVKNVSDARAQIRWEIEDKEKLISSKEFDVKYLRLQMDKDFSEHVNQLKREKNYWAFNYSSYASLLANIKEEMRRELDAELRRENEELAAIDNMIARINRIALESTR